jgi:hypothetical protein
VDATFHITVRRRLENLTNKLWQETWKTESNL